MMAKVTGNALAVGLTLAVGFAWGETDLVRHVRTEMGTVNTGGREGCRVSTGNLYPMTARPWGFGGWTPQTRADGTSRWFYDYNDERICGIRFSRQPSPWIGDHAAWNFLPVTGEPAPEAKDRASWYSHKTETFGPDRYGVYLADFDVTAEVTPALHGAIARFTFPQSETPGLVVNPFKDGAAELSADGLSIVGFSVRNANHRGWGAPVKGRFAIRLSCKAVSAKKLADGALYVRFAPTKKGERMEMRVAMSFISDAQAAVNLAETEGKTFDALAAEARAEWNERLGRIRVTSDDVARLQTFYTCFYRTMLFPLAVWEKTADGQIVHWSPSTGETRPGHYYAGTGFWDTFRALFPLLNFLAPEMNAKMMEGLENCWKECGWLPEWSSPGLSNCMIGNNSASVVADAWLAGVRGNFDINELWKAVVHGANNAHPTMSAVGRCGVEHYNAKGYVPRDVGIRESAARTLEYAYDDWCIAELGQAIGRPAEEVALYRKRSGNWRNVFDPVRKIAVGRNADGSFNPAFNPYSWGGDFTEGCAYHYTWSVFQDVPGLCEAMGGKKAFEGRLDEIFALPPVAECSYYKVVIHEAREMQIMNFGQYAHGNQPIQHMVYLYDWCDAWPKAQRWAREVMDRLYRPTPDGYCGDEDNGQTSAWYVWSALGMYPVCPASGEYALGAPLFDAVDVTLPSGKTLAIRAPGAAAGATFDTVSLAGADRTRPFVRRADLARGGTLAFGRTPAAYVDPFIGTLGNAHCFPNACVPFGLVQAGPASGTAEWKYTGGYQYDDAKLYGFVQDAISGTGVCDLGDVLVQPFCGSFDEGSDFRFAKSQEAAKAGYYTVTYADCGVTTEVTASPHAAIYRIAGGKGLKLLVDQHWGTVNKGRLERHVLESETDFPDDFTLTGHNHNSMWVDRHYYFAMKFSRKVTGKTLLKPRTPHEKGARHVLEFAPGEGPLYVKIALSATSREAALANLAAEMPDFDFDARRADAVRRWNDFLGRAEVVEGTEDEKTTFYTSLYHLGISPNDIADVGAPADYGTLSLWDTFRAAHPLYTILCPERVTDFVASMMRDYELNGFLPIWTLWDKDNQCMIGTHSVPVLVDAYLKGFAYDWEKVYAAVRNTLREKHPNRRKEGWETIDRYGYFPFDQLKGEGVSRLLECAYDDWCAARLAEKLGGREADVKFFDRRAQNYRNVFDKSILLVRGKDSQGRWREPYDPIRLGHGATTANDFTEGNGWQYTWHVMHDPEGLVSLFGGKQPFATQLEKLFTMRTTTEGDGFVLDVTGLIGQYAHGNEPSHHTIYFFQYADRGDLTAKYVREVCDRFYLNKPDGLSGNDDCGQMSAWYVFSAMGFYPFNPCGGDYVLGAPQIPAVKLNLANGRTFTVFARNLTKENKYVKSVRLNGRPLAGFILRHADILKGGTLEFEMTADPQTSVRSGSSST